MMRMIGEIMEVDEPTKRMIFSAVKFAEWAAGQGISPLSLEGPEDFLFEWATSYDRFDGDYYEEFVNRVSGL